MPFKISDNTMIAAGIITAAALVPIGIIVAFTTNNGWWLAISLAALLFFMGG